MKEIKAFSSAVAIVVGFLFSISPAFAITYPFNQTSWGGGATSTTAVHPTNESGWTKFSTSTSVVASSTGITLASTSSGFGTRVNLTTGGAVGVLGGSDQLVSSPDGNSLYDFYISNERSGDNLILNIALRRSLDGGATWSGRIDVTNATSNLAMGNSIPVGGPQQNVSVHVASSGIIHLIYTSFEGTFKLYHISSADGGATWSAKHLVSGVNTTHPSLDIDVTGVLHVIDDKSGALTYQRSTDNGVTWSAGVTLVAYGQYDNGGPRTLIVDPSDATRQRMYLVTVYAWDDGYDQSGSYLRFYRSTNGGTSWTMVNDFPSGANLGTAVGFVADASGTLYVDHMVAGAVLLYKSGNTGTTWATSTAVSAPGKIIYNTGILVSPTPGSLAIPYRSNEAGDVYPNYSVRFSTDYGATWGARNDIIATGAGSSDSLWAPQGVLLSSGARFVWTDTAYNGVVNLAYRSYTTGGFASSGSLTGSAYNTTDPGAAIGSFGWNEDSTLPTGTAVTVSLRTASSSAGLASASWSDFTNASVSCTKSTGSVTCSSAAVPAGMKDGSNDQWFQYKLAETSNGASTPALSSFTLNYVSNAPPVISATTALQIATSTDVNLGKIKISYSVSDADYDTDNAANGHVTSTVTPSFEYSLDGGSNWNIVSTSTMTGASTDQTLTSSSTQSFIAYWNARTQLGTAYSASTKIRVTVDDHQLANNTAATTTAAFTLDTTSPTVSLTNLSAASGTLSYSFSDSSNLVWYRFSASALSSSTPSSSVPWIAVGSTNATSGVKTWNFVQSPTIYAEAQDIYGNDVVAAAAVPLQPQNFSVAGNVISWTPYVNATGATFGSYAIERSTGGAWSSIYTSTNQSASSYTDPGASQGTTYFYRMKVIDSDNDVSTWATSQMITANLSTNQISYAFTGAGTIQYRMSNGPAASSADGMNGSSGQLQSVAGPFATGAIAWIFSSSSPSLYYEVVDGYGNDYTASMSLPTAPSGLSVKDVSNIYIGLYQAYLSWATSTAPNFSRYEIWRSSSGAYALFASTSPATANSFTDIGLMPNNIAYYYKVRTVDTSGNISDFSPSVFITPTGHGGGPAISNVGSSTLDTSAVVTWNTNVDSDGTLFYSTSNAFTQGTVSSIAGSTSGAGPFVHTVNIPGLTPATTYYFYMQSTDVIGNTTIDKNNYDYYAFATTNVNPPVISAVTSTPFQNSAQIRWTTDKPSNSGVHYGTVSGTYPSSVILATSSLATDHSVSLINLQASTTYYYYVISTDSGNNTATSSEKTFMTAPSGAPQISSVATTTVSDFGATVTWRTTTNADSHVFYSTATSSFTLSAGSDALVGGTEPYAHSVTFAGLTPSTRYYFYVQSVDAFGNYATDRNNSEYYSFVTTNSAPPVISSIRTPLLAGDTASVAWITDKLSDSRIQYGTSTGLYSATVQSSTLLTDHQLFLTGLTPSMTYYYVVKSTDAGNNEGASIEQSFTTPAPVFSNVTTTYIGDTSVIVSWQTTLDSNSYVHSFVPSASSGGAGSAGTSTYVGGSAPFVHSVQVDGLTAGTTYLYYLESNDTNNVPHVDDNFKNYYTFTTTDHLPPVITKVAVPVIGLTAAIVTWTTDKFSTSQVEWGTKAGIYSSSTVVDASLATTHAVPLTGLPENTTLFYRVISRSALDVGATSGEGTFATASPVVTQTNYLVGGGGSGGPIPDTTPPVITNVTATSTAFDATVTFTTSEPTIGIVEYGPSMQYGLAASDATSSIKHTAVLKGLVMGTPYHYMVKAIDRAGNSATSSDATVTTQYFTEASATLENAYQFQQEVENGLQSILPSLVPPFVETPVVTNITESGATVTWRTNVNSYSAAFYATDADYDPTKSNPYTSQSSDITVKTRDHAVALTGLQQNSLYHVMAESFSIPGVFGKSADITFRTKVSKVTAQVSNLKPSSLRVSWSTGIPSNSMVQYKDVKTGVTKTITDDAQTTLHSVNVENLTPARTYEVTASGYTAEGNLISAANVLRITTTKDTTPPKITNIKIQTIIDPQRPEVAQAVVSWATDKPANSAVYYDPGVATGEKPLSHLVKDLESYTNAHVLIVPNLTPGGVYSIQVVSVDLASNTTAFAPQTIVVSQQSQSILNVILNNFQNTFQFLQKIQP